MTARQRRRATRNVDVPCLGLRRLSLGARGLTAEEAESAEDGTVSHGRKYIDPESR